MTKKIEVTNIKAKARTRHGVTHEPEAERNEYNATICPGERIRIYGVYIDDRPIAFSKTFKIGDRAEYDSYNLAYTGAIVAIGAKTVTIDAGSTGENLKRLDLYTFCWRNWDYDAAKIAKRNDEEFMAI